MYVQSRLPHVFRHHVYAVHNSERSGMQGVDAKCCTDAPTGKNLWGSTVNSNSNGLQR
jgi:hypothetical protein